MDKAAIVVLNWNGIGFLMRFLPKLARETSQPGFKIYLADNGSSDNSIEWTKENLPEVEIIRMQDNYGFAGGYNRALEMINAEYYVIINSDIEVTENWLTPIIDHLEKSPETAICQPKILSETNRECFEYAGAAGGYLDRYGYPFCRGRIQNYIEKDKGQYDNEVSIFWASGACMVIRSSVWTDLQGFDNDFFAHMEEIDLCWRVLSSGYEIRYIPESVVYHVGGGTLSYNSPRKVYLNFRNNLFMLHKNLPGKNYKRIIFTRMLLDGIAGIRFFLMLKFSFCFQIFKGHISYYRNKRELDKKRDAISEITTTNRTDLILNKSVILGFYIKGKKLFTDYSFDKRGS
jgi:hypothetical protein